MEQDHLNKCMVWCSRKQWTVNQQTSLCLCHQAQHSHHVIQQVLNHLDTHNKDTPRVRAGIVQVLLETVAIAAKGSVGELHQRFSQIY